MKNDDYAKRLVEAALEAAAERIERSHTWITSVGASALIRSLDRDAIIASVSPESPPEKTAALVIDSWKLPIFTQYLQVAGFKFGRSMGLTAGTLTLFVRYQKASDLTPVIQAANAECDHIKEKAEK